MTNDLLMPLCRLHGHMYETQKAYMETRQLCNRIREADEDTVLFVLSPTHGNLGDHAIALSTTRLLAEINIKYLEITTVQLTRLKQYHKLGVMNGRKIIVNGGGNLGTLWFSVEKLFRSIIQNNPKSTIVCLPNTIVYEQSKWGNRELERSEKIYKRHPSLLLYARERISFEFMKERYPNVKLMPDMVLFMNESKMQKDRKGCLLCLRNDLEKNRTAEQEGKIVSSVRQMFHEQVRYTDMYIGHSVSPENRIKALENQYEEFKKAQLVITDRLHGMIFAAITGTPCIVMDSRSPKVRGCYEWIQHLKYIRFADDAGQIETLYMEMPKSGNQYDSGFLRLYYESLKRDILELKR